MIDLWPILSAFFVLAVGLGGELMARRALQTHFEANSKEFREGHALLASKVSTLERVQGGTDIRLDQIRNDIAEIKAMLSPRSQPRRGK